MKLVYRTSDEQEASRICSLLEGNGIPAFTTNENVNRLRTVGMDGIGIFVHINAQKNEAINLIDNPDYIVKNKVDVNHFYEQTKNTDINEVNNILIKNLLKALAGLIVVGVILVIALKA